MSLSAKSVGLVLACIAGIVAVGGGCERGKSAAAAAAAAMAERPAPMVATTQAISRDVPVYLDEIGKCASVEMVAIKPQVSGQITQIGFEEGKDVQKGQLLVSIDKRPYEAAQAQAKAQRSQAKAQLDLAKLDWERVKDLPRSVEPQSDLDAKKNAIDVANAQIEAAEAAIQAANVNLAYCTIEAPVSGLAGQRMVDVGNVVIGNNPMSGANAALLTIQRLDPIYADFTINEGQLLSVRQEMAHGTLKTMVKLPEDKDYREGALTFLDNSVQDGSGTVKLRATLKNEDRHLWPGQFVQVRLVLKVAKDAVLVPTSVPQMSQKGPFALVVKDGEGPDGKPKTIAEMRPVKLGQRHGDMIVIDEGIAAGERVITDGQMMVQPGLPVAVMAPAAGTQMAKPSGSEEGTASTDDKVKG
jgi:multidrug efflux system membrane fusion protein